MRIGKNLIAAFITFTIGVITTASLVRDFNSANSHSPIVSNVAQTTEQPDNTEENAEVADNSTGCLNADEPKISRNVVSCIVNSKVVNLPPPSYPAEAKEMNISGEVSVTVVVDEEGKIIWARVNSGHPLLQNSVKKVVCQAQFIPTKLAGKPIKIRGLLTYKFVQP